MYNDEIALEISKQKIVEGGLENKPDDLKAQIEDFESKPKFIKDMLAKSIGMENGDNATAVILLLWDRDQQNKDTIDALTKELNADIQKSKSDLQALQDEGTACRKHRGAALSQSWKSSKVQPEADDCESWHSR